MTVCLKTSPLVGQTREPGVHPPPEEGSSGLARGLAPPTPGYLVGIKHTNGLPRAPASLGRGWGAGGGEPFSQAPSGSGAGPGGSSGFREFLSALGSEGLVCPAAALLIRAAPPNPSSPTQRVQALLELPPSLSRLRVGLAAVRGTLGARLPQCLEGTVRGPGPWGSAHWGSQAPGAEHQATLDWAQSHAGHTGLVVGH